MLAALSLLLLLPACSSGSDDGNGGNNDNANGNGNNGNGGNDSSPGAPTGLAATANGSSAIELSWTAPASNGGSSLTGYRIFFKQEGAADYSSAEDDTGNTETSYVHAGLEAETEYSYHIYAINANGAGPASNEATATTASLADDPKPGAPTNLMATAGDRAVILSWDDPEYCGGLDLCNATPHQHWLEYKLASADWGAGQVVASNPHAATHTVTGLENGRSYDFRLALQLTGADDRGPYANPVSAQPEMESDLDGDGTSDAEDVDDDNDGLIEVASRAELENLRHNLAGSSYKDSADATGDTTGAPTTEPANCADVDTDDDGDPANDMVLLCGYELAGDIDLQGTTSATSDDPPVISCDTNEWSPIGDSFGAIFEGNSHTISNLCIEGDTADTDWLGLFRRLDGAIVRNLTIAELYIESKFTRINNDAEEANDNRLGGLAGYVTGDAVISNVAVADSDSNIDLQGATTYDQQYIGGLVGFQEGGRIESSSAAIGDVNAGDGGDRSVGGLVGIQNGDIIDSHATVASLAGGDGVNSRVGGLVGVQSGDIIASFAIAASLDGGDGQNSRVGGLVGNQGRSAAISASYAIVANVKSGLGEENYAGGLVGLNSGRIIASYAIAGNIAGGDEDKDYLGGLVGIQTTGGSVIASFAMTAGDIDGGAGNLDQVGGLVGFMQTGKEVVASYAMTAGSLKGGDGGNDRAGGLVGYMNSGRIIASYVAADKVNAGEDTDDQAGALVGSWLQIPGNAIIDSYGFVSNPSENIVGTTVSTDGTPPIEFTAATGLTIGDDSAATYAGDTWSSDVWDFSDDTTQAPVLKYLSGYTFNAGGTFSDFSDDTHAYSCAAADLLPVVAVCGTTLLPGQGRGPVPSGPSGFTNTMPLALPTE